MLLLSSLVRAQPHIKVSCDALPELNDYLAWVRSACEQTGATFASPATQLPSTCASPGCATAVNRFDADCGGYLGSDSAAFATYLAQLRIARSACAGSPSATMDRVVQPYPYPVIRACNGFLTDGAGNYGPGWDRRAILDAGPGRKVLLSFGMLQLASVVGGGAGDFIQIFDGPNVVGAGAWRDNQLGPRLTLNAKPDGALTSSGRYLRVRFVSDPGSVGASGFSASIACVCENSAEWVDAAGRHCAQYGGGGLACGDGVRGPPQGSIPSTGLVLSAEEACPLACGACATPEPEPESETDPCASAPCQHGGTCIVGDGPGGHRRRVQDEQCTLAQFSAQVPALNGVCCDDPGECCSGGLPSSCDAECAAVFLPLVHSCGNVLSQFLGSQAQQHLVVQCQASQGLAARGAGGCACEEGWGGDTCADADAYSILGADESRYPNINGRFVKTEHACHGRPVYQLPRPGHSSSLLFLNTYGKWMVGNIDRTDCDNYGYLQGSGGQCGLRDTGDPEMCTTWQQHHGGWSANPNVTVSIAPPTRCL
jgi:hypothetical protein